MPYHPPIVLTIAGSDSGGGAGIQADLKTFAALGVQGLVSVTAVTAQNTEGIVCIQEISPETVRLQIDAVVSDTGVKVAKTGMLYTPEITREVAGAIMRHRLRAVVDPVMVSKSGAVLLRPDAVEVLSKEVLPICEVVTPNLDEAERLSGLAICSVEDSKEAGARILKMGPKAVVVKGGHLSGDPIDVLCAKGRPPIEYMGRRIRSSTTHGTGCVFSASLASFLALGLPIERAVGEAKGFVSSAIMHGLAIGSGTGPVDPVGSLREDAERYRVLATIQEALALVESSGSLHRLFPECQINLVMALPAPYARGSYDVCGIPGRIHNAGGRLRATACPAFGASKHVAGAVLTAMDFDSSFRSSMNVRYSEAILAACKSLGFSVGSYDRSLEPEKVKSEEGSSIKWGVGEAIRSLGFVPDVVYHCGDWGKEPMINIFGKDAVEVVTKALRIAEKIGEG